MSPKFPTFSEEQVAALEALFPPRCLKPRETVEVHLRYAGAVDLIADMRRHVALGTPKGLAYTADEEAMIDEMALATARKQQGE